MISRVEAVKRTIYNLKQPIQINRRKLATFGAIAFIGGIGGGGVTSCAPNKQTGEMELKLPAIEFTSNNPPPKAPPTAAATPAPQPQRVATTNPQPSNANVRTTTYPAQSQPTYPNSSIASSSQNAYIPPSNQQLPSSSQNTYGGVITDPYRVSRPTSRIGTDSYPVSRNQSEVIPCKLPGTQELQVIYGQGVVQKFPNKLGGESASYTSSEGTLTSAITAIQGTIQTNFQKADPRWIPRKIDFRLNEYLLIQTIDASKNLVNMFQNHSVYTDVSQGFTCAGSLTQEAVGSMKLKTPHQNNVFLDNGSMSANYHFTAQ